MATSVDILARHLAPATLVIFRLSGLAVFAPVIGSPAVPRRVKALLVFLLGIAVYPTLAAGPLAGQDVPLSIGGLAPLVVGELFVGAVIGFLALLPMVAMQMSGLVMGQQMGLGFARIYNPAMDEEGDVLEQSLFFLGLLSFLTVGGLEQMTLALVRSFQFVSLGGAGNVVAVGGYGLDNGLMRLLTGVLLAATELALRVSAPLLCLFFLETVSMGFLSKSMPALNLMALGFPLRIMLGLAVIVLGMGAVGAALQEFTHADIDLLSRWFVTGGNA
ncbi:MAG: flagellar biosynthetic protein FliR [Phycisphaerales bacterium]